MCQRPGCHSAHSWPWVSSCGLAPRVRLLNGLRVLSIRHLVSFFCYKQISKGDTAWECPIGGLAIILTLMVVFTSTASTIMFRDRLRLRHHGGRRSPQYLSSLALGHTTVFKVLHPVLRQDLALGLSRLFRVHRPGLEHRLINSDVRGKRNSKWETMDMKPLSMKSYP